MKALSKLLASAIVAVLPLSTFAHAGHGHENPLSPEHFIKNPEHSIPFAIVAALLIVVTWRFMKRRSINH